MPSHCTLVLPAVLAGALMAHPALAAGCAPIQFGHGQTTTVVRGSAPAEDTICFTLATGKQQKADLKITVGKNTIFSIPDMVDAQDAYHFTTERKTYEIDVGQLMRSATPERFALSVTVK